VFNNPVKIPQWTLPLNSELKEFSSPCAYCTHVSMPSWQSIFSQNIQQSYLLCTYAPTQCPPGRALRILSDSSSLELTTEFYLCALLAMLNAHLAELHRTPQSFCLQLCSSYTALPPRCSTTSQVFSELLISVLVPQHIFV
jgi:hypothetical protein